MTPLQKNVLLVSALTVFGLVFNAFALKTGFPYGYFWYGEGLGPAVFGVPLLTLIGFPVVYFSASALANRARVGKGVPFLLTVALIFLAVHLVTDPLAAAKGMWLFRNGGEYLKVPVGNFIGVLFTGSFAAFLFPNGIKSEKLIALLMAVLMGSVLLCVLHGLLFPSILGLVFAAGIAWFDLRKHGWRS